MPPENEDVDTSSFGTAIASSRKRLGMSQKDLAANIRKEDDNMPITPQYLNDIEHDRRSPSSDHMVLQFATALRISADVLYFLLRRGPGDVGRASPSVTQIEKAYTAFRTHIKGK